MSENQPEPCQASGDAGAFAAAMRLAALKKEDPSEASEEDLMWLWAGEAAADQGRLLTLYAIAKVAPEEDRRSTLLERLQSILNGL